MAITETTVDMEIMEGLVEIMVDMEIMVVEIVAVGMVIDLDMALHEKEVTVDASITEDGAGNSFQMPVNQVFSLD